VGKFFSFNGKTSETEETNTDNPENIWEEKDIADLLKDLANFDKINN